MNEHPDNPPMGETLAPDRSTLHTDMRMAPAFLMPRRNRAKNRARIDKFQRNQKAVRILKNAFKRSSPEDRARLGLADLRIDVSDRDTYASCKPIFRGVKKWVREEDRKRRLEVLIDDQRCRERMFDIAGRAFDDKWDVAPILDIPKANAEARAIIDAYHRQAPVTPYVNRGVPPLRSSDAAPANV